MSDTPTAAPTASAASGTTRPVDPGRVGIWTGDLDMVPSAQAKAYVAELDQLGYGAVWIPEAVGRDPMVAASLLLAGSSDIVLATGIASIWARDAMSMSAAHKSITEAFPGRFLLGLGVSHQPAVDYLRGHSYDKPLSRMRAYLDARPRARHGRHQYEFGDTGLDLAETRARFAA